MRRDADRARQAGRKRAPHRGAGAQAVWLACLTMACGLPWGAARAQSAPAAAASAPDKGSAVETITVTARKRDEKLIDVPISIQAFSAETLRASGTYDVQDLKAQAGFTYNENTGTSAGGRAWGVLTFRGLAGDTAAPYDNSGAFFVDGIYISGGVSSLNFNDAERVEVLKGPQNAFFGRSTFGGAVNIITRNPSTTLQGRVNTTMGSRGSLDADATVEGPLVTDFLRGRVSVMSHKKAAVARASDGGDLGAEGTKAVTGTLYITPTDNLWIRLRGNYQKDDDSSAAFGIITFPASNTSCTGKFYPGTNAAGVSQPFTPAYPYACGGIPKLGDAGVIVDANTAIPPNAYNAFVNNSFNDGFVAHAPRLNHTGMARTSTRTSAQAGLHLPYEMDLAFNAGHNEVDSMQIWDLDRSAQVLNFQNALPMLAKDSTVDMRLTTNPSSALRGLLGASYFTSLFQYIQIDLNQAPPFYPINNTPTLNTGNYGNAYSDVSALYGSVEYDITKQITASFDVRYQKDKIQSFTYAGVGVTSEKKNTLPRAILRFMPDKNTTTYVSYSEGVQPLTTNSGYTSASADGKAYISSVVPGSGDFSPQPKLTALELGLKQSLLNNRLQYTLAAYDQKWENRLTTSFIFNPPGCALGVVTPACPLGISGSFVVLGNEARIRGLEFAIDGNLTPQWQMGGTADYKHARWTKYNNSSTPALTGGTSATTTSNFNGNTVAKVPDWTLTLNSTFRQPLGKGWTGYLRGDLVYVGKAWDTDFNIVQTDPYKILNLRVGFEKADTTVELFVKNATNEKNWTSVIRSADLTYQPITNFSKPALLTGLQDPREFGVRLSQKF